MRLVVLSFLVACAEPADLWEVSESVDGPRFTLDSMEEGVLPIELELSDLPSGSLPFTGTLDITLRFQGSDVDLDANRKVEFALFNFHDVRQNLLDEDEVVLDPVTEHEMQLVGELEIHCDADPCVHGVDLVGMLSGPETLGVDWTVDATVVRSQTEDLEGGLVITIL